jgi:hypothetical protein
MVASDSLIAYDFGFLTSSGDNLEVGASHASNGRGDHRDSAAEQLGDGSLADSRRGGVMHDNGVSSSHAT